MSEAIYELYCHTNRINGKQYVGITKRGSEKRWGASGSRYKKQAIGAAIQKYGWENFDHEILLTGLTKEEAEAEEKRLVRELGTLAPNGYNLTTGGNLGCEVSDETREKLRAINIGKPKSESVKAKVSAAQKGKIVSEETRRKISEARKGIRESEEWRRRISEGCKGRKWSESQREKMKHRVYATGGDVSNSRRVAQYTKGGDLVAVYDCITDAAKTINNNHHISECCKGTVPTAGGFVWRYIDN